MTTGGVNFICPKDGNPLFFTFRVDDVASDTLVRPVHCPACKTKYEVTVAIRSSPG